MEILNKYNIHQIIILDINIVLFQKYFEKNKYLYIESFPLDFYEKKYLNSKLFRLCRILKTNNIDDAINRISEISLIYGSVKRHQIQKNIDLNIFQKFNFKKKMSASKFSSIFKSYIRLLKLKILPSSTDFDIDIYKKIKYTDINTLNLVDYVDNLDELNIHIKIVPLQKQKPNTHLKCFRCGGGILLTRAQTRSCDEPETCFHTCVNCGHKF